MIQSRGNRAAGVIHSGVEMLLVKSKAGNKMGQRLRDRNWGFTAMKICAFPMFATFAGRVAAHLSAYFNWISHTSGVFSQNERAIGDEGEEERE